MFTLGTVMITLQLVINLCMCWRRRAPSSAERRSRQRHRSSAAAPRCAAPVMSSFGIVKTRLLSQGSESDLEMERLQQLKCDDIRRLVQDCGGNATGANKQFMITFLQLARENFAYE